MRLKQILKKCKYAITWIVASTLNRNIPEAHEEGCKTLLCYAAANAQT